MIQYRIKLRYRNDVTGKSEKLDHVCSMNDIHDMLEQCEIDGHSIMKIRIEKVGVEGE